MSKSFFLTVKADRGAVVAHTSGGRVVAGSNPVGPNFIMPFNLYCSEKKQKLPLTVLPNEEVKIYSCGPTVYNFAHIGNFRTYLFNDVLRRSLKAAGFRVRQAMNLTDIDDKTIHAAKQKKPQANLQDLQQYTQDYIDAFFVDLQKLNIEPVEENPRATEHIDSMIDLVNSLLENKHAYSLDNSVYFSIQSKKDYGRLSGVDLKDSFSGARYQADEYSKESLRDFALWKHVDSNDTIAWETSFGRGRPGWHLECSAMIKSIFDDEIDIHTGGVDLIFPHHENEIAQSECAYNHNFVKHWVHCEHLLADGKKMSKSLGNFYTLRDLEEKGFSPLAFRYFVLTAHYSQKINFTLHALDQAESALKRIKNFWQRFSACTVLSQEEQSQTEIIIEANKHKENFLKELKDNLNTPRALADFFELLKKTNNLLDSSKENLTKKEFETLQEAFLFMDSVLSLLPVKETLQETAMQQENKDFLENLLQERNLARKQKNYALADSLREKIFSLGFEVVDGAEGSFLKKRI